MARTLRRTYPNLASYLEATGQTQAQLATKLGKSQAFVSKLLRGLIQPSLDEALRISSVVGVPVETLVSRERNILTGKS
jgi:transcriptional regulator with XRE-family HTH domain